MTKHDILLDVQHVSHVFPLTKQVSVKALDDVSFQIRRGEIFGLVGESGSGKSTAARCAMGILQPSGGHIFYNGVDLCDKAACRANKKMLQTTRRMIFQDSASSLDPRMTVCDIIAEPMRIHHIAPPRGTYRKEAEFQMYYVGLDKKYLDKYPSELSGGQRQRVAIARALCMEPELLVADEPIASLDVSIQAQIVNLFRHLQREHGFSFLFIAHDLAMVEFLCDRVGVLYHGKLVEVAPVRALRPFAPPLYQGAARGHADPRPAHRTKPRIAGLLARAVPADGRACRGRAGPFRLAGRGRAMKKPSKILYFGKKALAFLLSVLVLSLAVFYVSRLAPGDPLVSYYGDRAEKLTPQERAQAEEKLGLDEPIFTQYVRWAQNALRGDFGISYKYKMPAGEVIASRAGNTLLLGGVGFVLIFSLSLLLGMLCARREGTLFDRAVCKLGTITSCIPEFWLSLLLILIFAIELRVLPSSGAYSIGQQNNIADRAAHLILPLAVVVLGHLWYYAYMIRNRLLDEMRADYVLLAKAKGLTRRAVMLRHCLRNTMPTYLSIMAISVPHVLGGTYIVETVFSYPGLGTLAYESARYKDYNLLMLLSLLSGALVILCSIIAQTINEQIDPRIRAEQAVREAEVQP